MMDSVKKAFALAPKALNLFYLLAGINIITNITNLLVIPRPETGEMSTGKAFLVLVLTVLFALIGIFVGGGALAYIRDLIKTGAASLASFLDNAKKYFLRFLGASVIIFLTSFIVAFLLIVILGVVPVVLKPLIVLLLVASIIALAVFLTMPLYALVASDLGVMDAIKKGALMGKNNFLKILGLLAIILLIVIVIILAITILTGILTFILRPIANFVAGIFMAVANAAIAVLVNIVFMDFYLKCLSNQGAQPQQAPPQA